MKILIVGKNALSPKMLELLTGWGYKAITVTDSHAVWEMTRLDDGPNLILLDGKMPKLNSMEICRKLKQEPTGAPLYIILLTADKKDDIDAGLDAGADDYIVKPFKNNELRARIQAGCRIIALQKALLEKEKQSAVFETIGAVCHEMNQPLQVVSGVTELLMLDMKTTDPHYGKLTTLMEQIERMGEISKRLMKITRCESKKDHFD